MNLPAHQGIKIFQGIPLLYNHKELLLHVWIDPHQTWQPRKSTPTMIKKACDDSGYKTLTNQINKTAKDETTTVTVTMG